DNLAAEEAACMSSNHPDYDILAARIKISNIHKETKKKLSAVAKTLYEHQALCRAELRHKPLIRKEIFDIIMRHASEFESHIIFDRDSLITYQGIKPMEKSYLLKIDDKVVERLQHMWMRTAIEIHREDI